MPDTTDLLGLAIDKNPVDFADMFNQIVRQKAVDALENKRIELAQSIYTGPEDDVDFDEDDFDGFDDDDDDDDDEDSEDLVDLDSLDIDLEDLELELTKGNSDEDD
jgi:hypothetical protein